MRQTLRYDLRPELNPTFIELKLSVHVGSGVSIVQERYRLFHYMKRCSENRHFGRSHFVGKVGYYVHTDS